MARSQKRKVENYTHPEQKRINNPPVGLVTPETDRDAGKKMYAYDPHLDPSLHWAGKAERTSFDIPTVSLHVHERIDPRSVMEAVRTKNGEDFVQGSLFSMLEENPPLREAIDFYKHNWSNRLIAGDSLLVMNSLLEKEGMAGKVQMAYIVRPARDRSLDGASNLVAGLQTSWLTERKHARSPAKFPRVAERHYLEVHGFGLERFLTHSLELQDGFAKALERPGHGVEFCPSGIGVGRPLVTSRITVGASCFVLQPAEQKG